MSALQFLHVVHQAIILLKDNNASEANKHIDLAEQLLDDIPPDESGRDELLILNTMIRGYWNKVPSIDISDIESQYLKAFMQHISHAQKKSGI
ncbi:MAG TPA: hypothetical protein VF656_18125 [Pyrinomonadaceae bacterium]|jgi:hypothetical protein